MPHRLILHRLGYDHKLIFYRVREGGVYWRMTIEPFLGLAEDGWELRHHDGKRYRLVHLFGDREEHIVWPKYGTQYTLSKRVREWLWQFVLLRNRLCGAIRKGDWGLFERNLSHELYREGIFDLPCDEAYNRARELFAYWLPRHDRARAAVFGEGYTADDLAAEGSLRTRALIDRYHADHEQIGQTYAVRLAGSVIGNCVFNARYEEGVCKLAEWSFYGYYNAAPLYAKAATLKECQHQLLTKIRERELRQALVDRTDEQIIYKGDPNRLDDSQFDKFEIQDDDY